MIYLNILHTLRDAYCEFQDTIVSNIVSKEQIKKYGKRPIPFIEYENGDVLFFLSEIQYERFCIGKTYRIIGEDKLYYSGRIITDNCREMEEGRRMKDCDIYPCTIAIDRYRGTYRDKYMFDDESMGMWTAWNLDAEQIPADSEAEDVECANFWFTESKEHRYVFGVGNTPNEALENLAEIIGGME